MLVTQIFLQLMQLLTAAGQQISSAPFKIRVIQNRTTRTPNLEDFSQTYQTPGLERVRI